MKNDLEQFDALMGNSIKQLDDIIASLKLERAKLEPEPKPQTQVPTTIEQVYDEVEPRDKAWVTSVPSVCNAKQVRALSQLFTLVDCLDSHFGEGDGDGDVYAIDRDYDVDCFEVDEYNKPLITFKTEQAAQHALEHFRPLFERYYGVSE